MKKTLPLFPLGLVVYPNENLNLHIFEPRYKQLIRDCEDNRTTFGIPAFIDNRVTSYGTEVKIVRIDKIYEDGRMDVKTKGLSVFKILSFENPLEGRLYAGGEVQMIISKFESDANISGELIAKIGELYQLLRLKMDIDLKNIDAFSYEIAHRLGLSVEQEYELLCLEKEKDRQLFLLDHLEKAIPIVEEMERTKQLIQMNGHFKHFDPLNF